jgi:DNA-binding beta-propeller fold protein YncE
MTLRNDGYAPKLTAAVLVAVLFALAACTGDSQQAKKEEVGDIVWPLPPEQPRIKFIRSIAKPDDIGAKPARSLFSTLFGGSDESNVYMEKPYAVSADSKGRVFVGETALGKVFVFDAENKKFDIWGRSGSGKLQQPLGIAVDGEDRVYVSDGKQQRVVVFDPEGKFLLAMGGKDILERPVGIAIDESRDRVYVVDTPGHKITVFNKAGELITTIGKRGKERGQFNYPSNMALDRNGRLYVVDAMNFRIQILEPDGTPVTAFGQHSDLPGNVARPKGIGIDPDGHIYVVDAAFNNFQIFDDKGALLLFIGGVGKGPGQFYLPAGAYLDPKGRLYIADQFNRRIQIFQYLGDSAAQAESKTESGDAPAEAPPQ